MRHLIHCISLLFVSLFAINSSSIVGAEETLSLDQLEEKLKKYRTLFDRYDQTADYLAKKLEEEGEAQEANHGIETEDGRAVQQLSFIWIRSRAIIREDIERLEKQIDAYDEENPDINGTEGNNNINNPHSILNNQNDNVHNPDLLLPNRHIDTPLYLKIIIGVVAAALTSFLAILIWESLPKKKDNSRGALTNHIAQRETKY